MIVNLQPDGWEVIYHRAHALLAAQIAGAWHLQDSGPGLIDTIAAIGKFVKEQEDLQTQWREELGVKPEEAEAAYRFMQWCDRLSLILCQNQLPENERALEIDIGPDLKQYNVIQFNNDLITVDPWPFRSDKFTVKVEVSHLSQIEFANNTALKKALKIAPRKYRSWTFIEQKC
jgi:hypothetical protein